MECGTDKFFLGGEWSEEHYQKYLSFALSNTQLLWLSAIRDSIEIRSFHAVEDNT